ncbi:hypothetical protein L873DRAFT_1804631 [Choiromyces venosus 120613-1]|uniref:Alpha/beta hydrolase fold-3 domain-containing protein n=1 Tax=Choiromyces venosus 120613-1 TaxID=1336337 RepID=A0A3N4K4M2_9PEZI|nr:hypothetical protein L873DRAFT_1804631 [Choiromyces venosus 120613-1]
MLYHYTLPIPVARAAFEAAMGNISEPSPIKITTKILYLPVGPTNNVTVYFYKPEFGDGKEGQDLLPVLVYFHGGGWILGNPKIYERTVIDLIHETGAAVFFVYYTPSPEAVYPVPIEQSYSAVQWLLERGDMIGVNSTKMGFVGDSAGGAMSAAVILLSIKRKTPLPKYQVLFSPVTELSCESETYREFAQGPGLTLATARWMVSAYAPDVNSRLQDIASPARASDEDLAKFPETLIIVAEVDMLRQDGEDFGRRLQKLGVYTTIFRALGTIHDFVTLNPLAKIPATRAAIELAGLKLKKALC